VTYTVAVLLGTGFAVLLDGAVLRTNLLRRKAFWAAYGIVVAFQLLVDGVLTGRQLVVYDPHAVLGGATPRLLGDWRIAYAPVEDLLFGFSLVLQTLAWWLWWERRARRAPSNAGTNTAARLAVPTEMRRSNTR